MHNLSMTQALGLWEELVAAYHKKNGFGTDTAEIYLYRLMPCDPGAEHNGPFSATPLGREARDKRLTIANQSLVALIEHFETEHADTRVWIDLGPAGEGKRHAELAAPYLTRITADHRVHLQVRHLQVSKVK